MGEIKGARNMVEYLTSLLSNNKKYVTAGKLNRSILIEDIQSYNRELIEILLSDDIISSRFTEIIAETTIFKIEALIKVLELKSYMSDNYTKYANEIGLYVDGKSLIKTSNVVLNWPYKDAFLTAGMTKEEVES